MKPAILNTLLAIVLLAIVGLTWYTQHEPTERTIEFLPEMYYSIPFDPQSSNSFFEDGKTLRSPVKGTIPRGLMPIRYKATPEEAALAGNELQNPYDPADSKHIDEGGKVYGTFCQPCHGPAGMGDGIITKYGFPPPPSLMTEKGKKMKDGQIFHVITFGQANMPSLASQMSREERWLAIAKVRSMQQSEQKSVAATVPPATVSSPDTTFVQ